MAARAAFLAVAPAALLVFIGVYIAFAQIRYRTPPVFEWPTVYPRARSLAWIAVLLAVAAIVVDLTSRAQLARSTVRGRAASLPPFPPAGGPMTEPWLADACSLVEEFRAGRRSPVEELEATLAAIEASTLNAFSYVAAEKRARPRRAPMCRSPFGGVPIGVKELTSVAGWPADRGVLSSCAIASPTHDKTMVQRLRAAGAVLVGLTTASEFGGINLTFTKLNGATREPVGRSSARPADRRAVRPRQSRAVSCTIATGGDGGGSIRIPAAFTGLLGLKNDVRTDPEGPRDVPRFADRDVSGCLSRSVARHRPLPRRVQRLRPARSLQPAARRRAGRRGLGSRTISEAGGS